MTTPLGLLVVPLVADPDGSARGLLAVDNIFRKKKMCADVGRNPFEPAGELLAGDDEPGSAVFNHVFELGVGVRNAERYGYSPGPPYAEENRGIIEPRPHDKCDPFFAEVVYASGFEKARRYRRRSREQPAVRILARRVDNGRPPFILREILYKTYSAQRQFSFRCITLPG